MLKTPGTERDVKKAIAIVTAIVFLHSSVFWQIGMSYAAELKSGTNGVNLTEAQQKTEINFNEQQRIILHNREQNDAAVLRVFQKHIENAVIKKTRLILRFTRRLNAARLPREFLLQENVIKVLLVAGLNAAAASAKGIKDGRSLLLLAAMSTASMTISASVQNEAGKLSAGDSASSSGVAGGDAYDTFARAFIAAASGVLLMNFVANNTDKFEWQALGALFLTLTMKGSGFGAGSTGDNSAIGEAFGKGVNYSLGESVKNSAAKPTIVIVKDFNRGQLTDDERQAQSEAQTEAWKGTSAGQSSLLKQEMLGAVSLVVSALGGQYNKADRNNDKLQITNDKQTDKNNDKLQITNDKQTGGAGSKTETSDKESPSLPKGVIGNPLNSPQGGDKGEGSKSVLTAPEGKADVLEGLFGLLDKVIGSPALLTEKLLGAAEGMFNPARPSFSMQDKVSIAKVFLKEAGIEEASLTKDRL